MGKVLVHFQCLWMLVSEVELEYARTSRDTHLLRKNAALADKIAVAAQQRVSFPHVKILEDHSKLATLLRDPSFIAGFTPTCSSTHVILAQTHLRSPGEQRGKMQTCVCVWRACRGARALSMLPVCRKTDRREGKSDRRGGKLIFRGGKLIFRGKIFPSPLNELFAFRGGGGGGISGFKIWGDVVLRICHCLPPFLARFP